MDNIVCVNIVDNGDFGPNILATYYLVNPDMEKLRELKEKVESRWEDEENGKDNPFLDGFYAVDNFVHKNFNLLRVEHQTIEW